ncbi:DUF1134 domain-containing protein [Altererythrobacter sp. KTW20L]|uniref:DUF1134 domain-containing protein n=1 Tax=Altererythrobacter sp. KTW20L TaxID=2942210 RepID=UPI0020C09379|nr:DUF1134 domain-containing protein [Altererythrobacter sp. KTW20L]MCL6250375.1 DUF1134 domain-containing protein [Altererythrobacter sp. KTW20L]
MLIRIAAACRKHGLGMAAAMLAGLAAAPLAAQSIERIDPDSAIDADLVRPQAPAASPAPVPQVAPPTERYEAPAPRYADATLDLPPETYPAPAATTANTAATTVNPSATYAEDDLIGAAEGLFGKGAEGLARLIEDILEKQGEPNAYIVGREGGGAFVLGVRYGSGTLFHRIEGNRPVYWTGPSIGFDAGANAGNTFVLVYNLDDTEELYRRYPAGEGQAYLVGGFTASYLRRGNTVLIPIRVGAGLRLGVNAGYMRFSHEQRWLPF